jgi:hypothetical protein
MHLGGVYSNLLSQILDDATEKRESPRKEKKEK